MREASLGGLFPAANSFSCALLWVQPLPHGRSILLNPLTFGPAAALAQAGGFAPPPSANPDGPGIRACVSGRGCRQTTPPMDDIPFGCQRAPNPSRVSGTQCRVS